MGVRATATVRSAMDDSHMPVAVFDIDGTLTDTTSIDVECYRAALRSELGLELPKDWDTLPQITDSGILAALCRREGRPELNQEAEKRVALRVRDLLEKALLSSPDRFRPISGAREILSTVRKAGWRVAIATGAWRESALVKLRGARIHYHGIPLCTSSEHRDRREVIRSAIAKASLAEPSRGSVVFLGDGRWDARAAADLGCTFVGIGKGQAANDLSEAGAVAVMPDFSNGSFLVDLLAEIREGKTDRSKSRPCS